MINSRYSAEQKGACAVCGVPLGVGEIICSLHSALKPQPPTSSLIRQIVAGRYELTEVVGTGGMSIIFKARDITLGSCVAVKTLKSDMVADDEVFTRFCQEARAVQMLRHPHIIAVHEFGRMNAGQPFIVMDLLIGHTLGEVIAKDGRVPVKRMLKIFIEVCDALSHAHKYNIIHRDIKPDNIMLVNNSGDDDFVKLFDFGVAKFRAKSGVLAQSLTLAGDVLGTPLYMSPEQSGGKPLDSRSDIYSLGCVMYEALTGRAPLVGQNALATMQKHISQSPESLDKARPDLYIPDQLASLLFRTLEKDPDFRYQSALDLKRDLEVMYSCMLNGVPIQSAALPGLARLKPIPEDAEPTVSTTKIALIFAVAIVIALGIWVLFHVKLQLSSNDDGNTRLATALPATSQGYQSGETDSSGLIVMPGPSPRPIDEARTRMGLQAQQSAPVVFPGSAGVSPASGVQQQSGRDARAPGESRQQVPGQPLMLAKDFQDLPASAGAAAAAPVPTDSHTAATAFGKPRTGSSDNTYADETACAQALAQLRQAHQGNSEKAAEVFSSYAAINTARGNYKAADGYLLRDLAIQQQEVGSTNANLAPIMRRLAQSAQGERDYKRAEAYYKLSIAIAQFGPGSSDRASGYQTQSEYTRLLKKMHGV